MHAERVRFIALVLSLICSVPLAAHAAVVNGSFETGTFTGWSTIGDTSIQTSSVGITPTDGQFMALLTTLCNAVCDNLNAETPFSSNSAVLSQTVTQGFFGFTQTEISSFIPRETGPPTPGFPLRSFPAGEGSGIKQTITGTAGDILSFDFYYLTLEGALNADEAYFTLIPTDGSPKTFAFLNPLDGQGSISPIDFCHRSLAPSDFHLCGTPSWQTRTTDWQHVSFALPSTGTFTAGWGIWEGAEGTVASAIFIDNISLTAVPEPSTLVLLGVGLAGLVVHRRRGRS